MKRNVKSRGIYYDMHHHVVYLEPKYNIYHTADLNAKQVSILPHDDCESPRRCVLEVSQGDGGRPLTV